MHLMATRMLYDIIGKVGRILQRECGCDGEKNGAAPLFAMLFHKMRQDGEDCIRMTEVSRRLMITKPAATQAVGRLVEKGLVERVNDQNDRRAVCIRPSQLGQEFFEKELEIRLEFVDRAMERMGEKDATLLVELLNRFLNAVEEELEEINVRKIQR